jgi:dUTP pyrophosphatase
MDRIKVKIKRLSDTAIVPTYGSEKAAGLDLYADLGYHNAMTTDGLKSMPNFIEIPSHTNKMIGCGFAFQLPEGYCVKLLARSGLSSKHSLRPANCTGLLDEDYRGEYMVALHNDSNETKYINHGDRICQITFEEYHQAELEEVDELDETKRGDGGFGSTGK